MLIGTWKNFDELEDSLTLDELESVLSADRIREKRNYRFFAALKGIDLDKEEKDESQAIFDRAKRRADAILAGKSQDEVEAMELDEFGIDLEIEE